ncbi:MAG: arginine--tRNA ligase, partial [Patescibacteria group bacterium]
PDLDEEARKIFKQLEEGDELRLAMWQWMVSESIKDLSEQFQRLGIHFHHILGESFYRKGAEEVIQDGVQKGLFVEGEKGSLIFEMKGGETPALIRKSDGTTLYLTRDVATVKYRTETWHPELILYVVDHAQSLHFQQDFAVSKALGYAEDTELEHVSFGRMSFKDRSMSSRKGNVIILDDLLDEAVKRAAHLAADKGTELPRGELKELAELVGVSSVKYAVLSQDRNKDI